MASPFQSPPAGTEVPPSSDARYFYRRQVYSRNPVTGDNWTGGRTVNFQAEASGGHSETHSTAVPVPVPVSCRTGEPPPPVSPQAATTPRAAADATKIKSLPHYFCSSLTNQPIETFLNTSHHHLFRDPQAHVQLVQSFDHLG